MEIQTIVSECKRSFANDDRDGYERVAAMLSELPQTEAVTKAIRLAQAGPTLSSPRFAYPHIISALTEA